MLFENKLPTIESAKKVIGHLALATCLAITPIPTERTPFHGSSLSGGIPLSSRVPAERNDQENPFKKPKREEERVEWDTNKNNKPNTNGETKNL